MQLIKKQFSELKSTIAKVPPVLMTLFVLSVIIMNLAANKSIDLSFLPGNNTAIGEFGWLALDCGLLVSWMAFFTMDIIVRRFGPKASTQLTIVAVFINLLTCLIFLAIGKIPGAWGESYIDFGGDLINTGLNNTISGTWYVLMGSTIAFISSAIVHGLISSVLTKVFKKIQKRLQKCCASRKLEREPSCQYDSRKALPNLWVSHAVPL